MILVDTSIWIRYFYDRSPYADVLESLLLEGEVCGHELVYGELFIGDKGGRAEYLKAYEKIFHLRLVRHSEVLAFAHQRKLNGRGLGWIDVHLLASAIVERQRLWTADLRLASVAEELGVGWR